MSKKILVIRFNAIGDIVLTSPVVKALAISGHEVHYLCKKTFSSLIDSNPHVSKTWFLDTDWTKLVAELKSEGFDCVLDLHNTLRSNKLRKALGLKSYALKKDRWNDMFITRFQFARNQRRHIVERFMDAASELLDGAYETNPEFYFPGGKSYLGIDLPGEAYVCLAVSTAHRTKNIPLHNLKAVIKNLDAHIILIGGPDDREVTKILLEDASNDRLIDYAGKLSIDESAYVISKSELLITGDTGMMHIAAALDIPVAAVFGSTHPILGYTPYYGSKAVNHAIIQNEELSCRPCTRQGRESCPKGHFKCMKGISVDKIVSTVEALLKA
ncbi:MAG: glycosyltransferase family 9 protein [Chitinophagia bacterium]|nr:glycosyltransferase family 9 protein [Chitinophagia bacterium]